MILLDTDILSHYLAGHQRVLARFKAAAEPSAIPIVVRIEALGGRLDAILKAAEGKQLLYAQQRLLDLVNRLEVFVVVQFNAASAAEFDRLRQNKKLKKIGRADLLIVSIALAHRAMLVTRNLRDFQQVPGLELENWAD